MKTWIAAMLAAALAVSGAGNALAQTRADVRKQVESSLVVKGAIDITADGRVLGHSLERADELPPSVVNLIARTAQTWQFEPVVLLPGTARARAPMSIRLVARKLDDGRFAVELRGAQFGSHAPARIVTADKLAPPRYPESAVYAGVGGTVYVVLRVGRDGRVEAAEAEQVNLRGIAKESIMQEWRKVLAQAALGSARKWTFNPPKESEDVDTPHWIVRVPVDFIAPGQRKLEEHEWQAYVPGPRALIPWIKASSSVDALAAGAVEPIGQGLQLLTPISQG